MRERIAWPIWLWLLALSLDMAIFISVGVALDDRQLLLAILILLALTIYLWSISRLTITLAGETLRVGRAQIDIGFISAVTVIDKDQMKLERGRNLDARAYLAIRFWIKGGVKIAISDSRDPTPYWLISMKQGAKLKELLGK